jgi:hypothetical protein
MRQQALTTVRPKPSWAKRSISSQPLASSDGCQGTDSACSSRPSSSRCGRARWRHDQLRALQVAQAHRLARGQRVRARHHQHLPHHREAHRMQVGRHRAERRNAQLRLAGAHRLDRLVAVAREQLQVRRSARARELRQRLAQQVQVRALAGGQRDDRPVGALGQPLTKRWLSSSSSRACRATCSPARVSSSALPTRRYSLASSCSDSLRTLACSAGWLMCSRRADSLKFSVSANTANDCSASRLVRGMFIYPFYG